MSSYKAVIAPITVRPHPNANRLQIGSVSGYQVIVGLDVSSGDLGIVFPAGGALRREYALHHALYVKHPDTGEKMGGYLDSNARIRSVKLRGVASEALWMPLDKLAPFGDVSGLRAGDTLTEFGGELLCWKYVPKRNQAVREQSKTVGKSRASEYPTFYEIGETDQLRSYLAAIPRGAVIVATEKLHGTSGRTGLLPRNIPVTWERRHEIGGWRGFVAARLRGESVVCRLEKVSGTRRTVLNTETGETRTDERVIGPADGYRMAAHERVNPRPGETIYYEIVGFDPGGAPIMARHYPKNDETGRGIAKQYGSEITYAYGLPAGAWEIYVYKITMTNERGDVAVLSPGAAEARAAEMGLKFVPRVGAMVYDGNPDTLVAWCNEIADGTSQLDSRQPREGVCLVVDHPTMCRTLKWKGWTFSALEEIRYSDPNYVDTEDES